MTEVGTSILSRPHPHRPARTVRFRLLTGYQSAMQI